MVSGLIILVDDNPSFRKMYSDLLTVHGYTVMTANSGAEALHLLLNCTPKVLILDVSMPEMDGIETCRQIRHMHGSGLPIIFLTSFNDVEKLRDCMNVGGDDYMIKSDKLDAILERVAFWSKELNRTSARNRRSDVVQEIEHVVQRVDQATAAPDLDEAMIAEMTRFVVASPSIAALSDAKTADSKCFLFGYIAGIVGYWLDRRESPSSQLFDYLRAVLSGSAMVDRDDIAEAIEDYDKISDNPTFMRARDLARKDCQAARDKGGDVMGTAMAAATA